MLSLLAIITIIILCVLLYLQHPKFGKAPSGERLKLIEKADNYKNGSFQNQSFTPALAEDKSIFKIYYEFLFKKFPNTIPNTKIPSVKTDIKNISINEDVLVWFGHSSYYFQLNKKRFLVDPVFSGNVSPIPNTAKSFKGSDVYDVDDLPDIDYLLITHDHYDHLDYETILKLKNKVKTIICPLGVGSHFEYWGFDTSHIIERNWYETISLDDNLTIDLAPTRHFGGRTFKRNYTLWTSYIVSFPDYKLYIGGDSGFDSHFEEIGKKFGEIDFALLENGQYNEAWKYIHLLPNEVLKASKQLNAKRLMPIHSSKFKLAHHTWNEPLKKVTELNNNEQNIATPKIGELVQLRDTNQKFDKWWEN